MEQEKAIKVIVNRLEQMGMRSEAAEFRVRQAISRLAAQTPQVKFEIREYAFRAFLTE